MLHITNGDAAVERLKQADLTGDYLPWRDVLHEGPVPADVSPAELRAVRARFLEQCGWGDYELTLQSLTDRDRRVEFSHEEDEVVLWFEHDLYDQLQLLQILDYYTCFASPPRRLYWVVTDVYISMDEPARLRKRFDQRMVVPEAALTLGSSAWRAFGSADPCELSRLAEQDLSVLPFLKRAIHRLMQQYPSTWNGLSRSEQQAMEVLARETLGIRDVYLESHHRREESLFLGDTTFALYLEALSRCTVPLLLLESGEPLRIPGRHEDWQSFWQSRIAITDAGKSVLNGQSDFVHINGIERWLGGVNFCGHEVPWRWDTISNRLTPWE